ncbi:hypothetical protein KKG29_05025 [Patescibacteria group bacterium]|nr:hypothetical protein [Desulfobacteraceae bacterium]MBU3980741.1 hypothetical protein [Pseudomonadota bacterium]MBU4000499.1 hypothetical protein [Patescibacteria group bacterium]MBU4100019.1 hypothetical protein [Pseudomonadota bacterium]MBU4126246.1 hypothetical protein [Pseudomonadota bacterium]
MGNKKNISIRKLAVLERAKALGLAFKRPQMSDLERQAREWKRQEEAEKSEVQDESNAECGMRNADCILSPFNSEIRNPKSEIKDAGSGMQNTELSDSEHAEINEGFDWKPWRSDQGEGEKNSKKPERLNTASIARIARKIMAREWARALGGTSLESDQAGIEREAVQYKQKKAAETERKELEQQRAHKQRTALEKALRSFGRSLLKPAKPVTPESAEILLKEALSEVGETISITWQPDGCRILLEPWEEKKLKRKNGETLPAVFQTTVDDNLMLTSYQKIEDPLLLRQTRNDIIIKKIRLNFRKSPGQDFHAFENAVAEGGRIIQSMEIDEGWKIKFEPWEEMRKRNLERKGRPPIVTNVIRADKDFTHISCERI